MNYALYNPPHQLKNIVKYFWMLESLENEVVPTAFQLMADGCPEIVFQCNGGFKEYNSFTTYFRAQRAIPKKLNLDITFDCFGIRLYPHALQPLMGMPADELTNITDDFNSFFDQEGTDLTEQVILADTTQQRISIVSDFLIARLHGKKLDTISPFVKQVIEQNGILNIPKMQSEAGLSTKQFERRFKAAAGFAPKYFSRIIRFQNVKHKFLSYRFKTLGELAQACNYYDQAHFIRDFKEFSGMMASDYFRKLGNAETEEAKIIKGLIVAKEL